MAGFLLFYVVVFMILGLLIYHSIFDIWYFNFGKAMIAELFGAFIFAGFMTALTLMFWPISFLIIIILGIVFSIKVKNPTGKKLVIIIFIIIAILTAITGIIFKLQQRNKKKEEEQREQETYKEIEKYYTPVEPDIYLKNALNMDDVVAGITYVCIEDNKHKYANIQYLDQTAGMIYIYFFVEEDGEIVGDFFECNNNADKPLIYKYLYDMENQIEVKAENSFVVSGDLFNQEGLAGKYNITDEDEVRYYLQVQTKNDDIWRENDINYEENIIDNNNDNNMDFENEYILPYSNELILTEDDLLGLSAQELTYARNEIYARHGYIFKSSELNSYFSGLSWYIPDESFTGDLEGIEQKNASFISNYQSTNGLEYKPQ